MNGSRVNPQAPADIFQDFDILYFVNEIDSFKAESSWIDAFGEMMILQLPDDMGIPTGNTLGSYAYLMQLLDGNRIDLTLIPIDRLDQLPADSLTRVLLDKDDLLPPFPEADESTYLPKPPTVAEFADRCNEFWWISTYVAKGLWRRELVYARAMFEEVLREQLVQVLTWFIGYQTDFRVNLGYRGKWLQQHLTADYWRRFVASCPDGGYAYTWDALFEATSLFREVAQAVARLSGHAYPQGDDDRVSVHLRHVRSLPMDSERLYE